MLSKFIDKKLKVAKYKLLEDGSYFGEISGLRGVWSNAKTKKASEKELREQARTQLGQYLSLR